MKRVLFLNHVAIVGGAELGLLEVARHYRSTSTVLLFSDGPLRDLLTQASIRVVLCPSAWAREGERGRTTRLTVRSVAELATTIVRVARIARGYDVLFANSQKALLVASAASVLARRPVLTWIHEILSREHFSRWNVRVNVVLANRFASRVLANSRATAAALQEWGGRKEKMTVLDYGFDTAAYAAVGEAEMVAVRNEIGLRAGPMVGLFGRITSWKGQHVLLEALPLLPGVQALIAGEAMIGDEAYLCELKERARALGVAHRVHFVGFRSDVPRVMQLVDVVLHTSVTAEPFGRVIVEGMLAGRPVVATRGGGVEEIVEDGVSGLLVHPNDAEDLAAAIARLLADPDLARRLAAAGRADALARWRLDRMLAEVDREVEDVASRREQPSDALGPRGEPLTPGSGSWKPR